MQVRVEIVGGEGDGLMQFRDGLGIVLLDKKKRAEVQVSRGEVGVEFKSAVELGAGERVRS